MNFESLYEVSELSVVHHIGYASEDRAYDFTIVYSKHFFGKTLVTCLQSGNTALLDLIDVCNIEIIKKAFKLPNNSTAEEVSNLLLSNIPTPENLEQY